MDVWFSPKHGMPWRRYGLGRMGMGIGEDAKRGGGGFERTELMESNRMKELGDAYEITFGHLCGGNMFFLLRSN